MPTTVNGVGTHYYGKKNLQKRTGLCESCNRMTELSSYDTRLWFVFIFIPIIPLGRKRILDYCPACTRHRAMSLAEWEELKQKNIATAMDAMKDSPADPKAAMELYRKLVAFGQLAEAEKLAAIMQERYPQSTDVFLCLAVGMEYLGRFKDAAPFYEKALAINPNLPEAKVGAAFGLIDKGRLDEARALLKFLETPSQSDDLSPLGVLANAYQNANRHKEALELFNVVLANRPDAAKDAKFRKSMKKSEKAAGRKESALPARRISSARAAVFAAVLLALLAAVFGSNMYIRRHRKLYVVSGLKTPVTIRIGQAASVSLPGSGMRIVNVPEGRHSAQISGAVTQNVDFSIESPFAKRWFDKRVFMLNVAGSALLVNERSSYAVGNVGDAMQMPDFDLLFGNPFVALDGIDYVFQPFPKRIQMERGAARATKSRLSLAEITAPEFVYALTIAKKFDVAMDLLEWHLDMNPDQSELLSTYLACAHLSRRNDQATAFLRKAAQRRPVDTAWHRMYQEMRIQSGGTAPVIAEYDELLAKEPGNSALLYLRGRLCRGADGISYYKRALEQDPSNAFANYASGFIHADGGDWAAARPFFARAVSLRPKEMQFRESFFDARMALAEFPALEQEIRSELSALPMDFDATIRLIDVLATQNKTEEAKAVEANYAMQCRTAFGSSADALVSGMRSIAYYSLGMFADLEKAASGKGDAKLDNVRFTALVEQGRLADAEQVLARIEGGTNDPFTLLTLGMAWDDAKDSQKAEMWKLKATEVARNSSHFAAPFALLAETTPVPVERLSDISMQPNLKAIVAVALARQFPELAPKYLALAAKLNVSRRFPFHLLNTLIRRTGAGRIGPE